MGMEKNVKRIQDSYSSVDPNVGKDSNLTKILNMPTKSTKRMWTQMEDEVLIKLAIQYQGKHWIKVAKHLKHRNAKQCSDRWNTQLKDKDRWNTSPWSSAEDALLLEIHRRLGNKWTKIALELPNRNATAIKNRYRSITRKK